MKNSVVLTLSLFLVSNAYSQVAVPAKEMTCRACHGVGGGEPITPNYPKLNSQNKPYLLSSLKSYRAGNRQGGLAAVMAAQALQLSDADMEALAAYYSSQK